MSHMYYYSIEGFKYHDATPLASEVITNPQIPDVDMVGCS